MFDVLKCGGTLVALYLAATVWVACGSRAQEPQGEETASQVASTEQPLAFSHRIHAGQFKMDCQYCHASARRGPVAGIPSVQRCVGCHLVIGTDRPQIVRLMEYWEQKDPIPWVRIHRLPSHARFNHQRHVGAGVTCQTCHGDVAQMDAAVQVASLTMGWCLTCHDDEQAPKDCVTCHY